jgi:hypothetical protein
MIQQTSPAADERPIRAYFSAMALRWFQDGTGSIRENALDYEIVQEQAAALGRLGSALEAALSNLSAHDAGERGLEPAIARHPPSSPAVRTRLVEDASYALWCFIVQREACGLRDQGTIVREYRVPAEVRNRVGVFVGNRRRPGR